MIKEIWLPIAGYEGFYEVSSLGRVKSFLKYTKILKPCKGSHRYTHIRLFKKGVYKQFYIHRLVAQTFISNPKNKPEVNHKDGNCCNNNLENLEWVTIHENKIHSYRILGRKSVCNSLGKFGKNNKISKPFLIKHLNGEIIEYEGGMDFHRRTGLNKAIVSKLRHKPLPYIFKFGSLKGCSVIYL